MEFPFVGPSYMDEFHGVAAQKCLNLYVEKLDVPDSVQYVLKTTPGLDLFATNPSSGGNRGLYASSGDRLFSVQYNKLFEVLQDGTSIDRGSLNTYVGPVSMADNGDQLLIVDGTDGWIFDLTSPTLTQITDVNFPACTFCAFQDGYFMVNETGTNLWHICTLLDGLSWTPAQIAAAEGSPDAITALISNNREVWLFGPKSYEVWYDAGDIDFPYARVPGSYTSIGILAPNSLCELKDQLFFLGGNKDGFGTVYMTQGYQVKRISTHAIEWAISQYTTPDDAIGLTYQSEGHYFYALSFQGGDTTWCFDLTTETWHQRSTRNLTLGSDQRWKALRHAFCFNLNLVADYNTGKIYTLSRETYTDDGTVIRRIRSCPHLTTDLKTTFYKSLQLRVNSGAGTTSGQGSNPQVALRWSNDGGNTWSNEQLAPLGPQGSYLTRCRWDRLGSSRDRVFETVYTEPTPYTILGATLEKQDTNQ